jgi:hypothetical protein
MVEVTYPAGPKHFDAPTGDATLDKIIFFHGYTPKSIKKN